MEKEQTALDNPIGGAEQVLGGTDEEFIANLYYAVSAGLVAKAAGVLGLSQEEEEYRRLSEEILSDRDMLVRKKEMEQAQVKLNRIYKYGLKGTEEQEGE